jgi:hypothetical protein
MLAVEFPPPADRREAGIAAVPTSQSWGWACANPAAGARLLVLETRSKGWGPLELDLGFMLGSYRTARTTIHNPKPIRPKASQKPWIALSREPACRQNISQIVEIWSQNRVHILVARPLWGGNLYINRRLVPLLIPGESLTPSPYDSIERTGVGDQILAGTQSAPPQR